MFRRFPIRTKLTCGALAPLLVAICLCSLAGRYIISTKVATQAQEKVRTDLNSAREVYRNELERIAELVDLTAASPFAVSAFSTGNRPVIAQLLSSLQRKKHLDILNAADARGRILYRAHNPRFSGDRPANDFLNLALKGVAVTGSTVLSGKQLAAEYPDLARRASISVVPTPHSRASVITVVRSGMVMVSAAPVRNAAGAVVGALYGAVLLNHNNTLVDKIKEIVYEGSSSMAPTSAPPRFFWGTPASPPTCSPPAATGPSALVSPRRFSTGCCWKGKSGWHGPSWSTTGT